MLQHTVPAVVDTRIWDGTRDPALITWMGEDTHRFDGTQLVLHTADGDVYPRPGWTLLRWPDGDLTVMSSRVAAKRLTPTTVSAPCGSEAAIQRVIALYERWVKAGTPIGTSISRSWDRRLVELRDAILGDEAEAPKVRGSLVRWYVERKDHDGWVPASSPTRPSESVVQTLAERRMEFPDREFRLVRATTAYAVEAEPSP